MKYFWIGIVVILLLVFVVTGMESNQEGANLPAVKNKNPGNLRPRSLSTYNGLTGFDDRQFGIFATPEDGYQALIENAFARVKQGAANLQDFGNQWAPASDNAGATNYGANLASQLGVNATYPIDLQWVADHAHDLAQAITINESGFLPWSDSVLTTGVNRGLAVEGYA